ncbi:hypothetical protein QF035_008822 [Streptomyces umbrinus]|uniref:Uncharacterized protein n=1 Tax=Streptomyces umbrinus TaxID=67370 RepID=A0ABU0T600_9ACTN|nr:hypothetical protein [Streptomyces umbrinus]MDQ1031240.1 hypothetical protein [Streptomyces umbrinus]
MASQRDTSRLTRPARRSQDEHELAAGPAGLAELGRLLDLVERVGAGDRYDQDVFARQPGEDVLVVSQVVLGDPGAQLGRGGEVRDGENAVGVAGQLRLKGRPRHRRSGHPIAQLHDLVHRSHHILLLSLS